MYNIILFSYYGFNIKVFFWFYENEINTHDVLYYTYYIIKYTFSMMNEHLILDILYNLKL